MKTKLTLFISALILCGLSFVSCDDDDKGGAGGDQEIPVESVEWKSDLKAGYQVALGDNSLNLANRMNITPENATDQKQSFTSSTTTVATISEYGQVTPVSIGTTSITVTVDGQSDSFTLSVVPEVEVPKVRVTGINIAKSDVEVALDNTLRLTSDNHYVVLPADATDKTVTFSSLDESIATVSETGVITGIAEGTTTVSVTSVDNEAVSGTFNVTVTPFYGDYGPRSEWTVEDMFPEIFGGESQVVIEGMFDGDSNTWLSFVKPGQQHSGSGSPAVPNPPIEQGGHITFTVDMKASNTVNYFRIQWRNTSTPGFRFLKFDSISGSNDNVTFEEIATNVAITGSTSALVSPDIAIPESTFRYIKFYCGTADCYPAPGNKTVSVAELWLGRAKPE